VLGTENADLSEHQRLAIMATFGMVNALVRRSKTVDTEPVIRCRDCKYRNEYGYCTFYLNWHRLNGDMDYCSDGERREE